MQVAPEPKTSRDQAPYMLFPVCHFLLFCLLNRHFPILTAVTCRNKSSDAIHSALKVSAWEMTPPEPSSIHVLAHLIHFNRRNRSHSNATDVFVSTYVRTRSQYFLCIGRRRRHYCPSHVSRIYFEFNIPSFLFQELTIVYNQKYFWRSIHIPPLGRHESPQNVVHLSNTIVIQTHEKLNPCPCALHLLQELFQKKPQDNRYFVLPLRVASILSAIGSYGPRFTFL